MQTLRGWWKGSSDSLSQVYMSAHALTLSGSLHFDGHVLKNTQRITQEQTSRGKSWHVITFLCNLGKKWSPARLWDYLMAAWAGSIVLRSSRSAPATGSSLETAWHSAGSARWHFFVQKRGLVRQKEVTGKIPAHGQSGAKPWGVALQKPVLRQVRLSVHHLGTWIGTCRAPGDFSLCSNFTACYCCDLGAKLINHEHFCLSISNKSGSQPWEKYREQEDYFNHHWYYWYIRSNVQLQVYHWELLQVVFGKAVHPMF